MARDIKLIATLSDVSVGYGTPQVISIARSLTDMYGAPGIIFEPDQPERPPVPLDFPGIETRRIYTATHPYTLSGQVEYNIALAKHLNELKPDLVVICAFLPAAAVLKMSHRPRLILYYGIEHTDDRKVRERRLFNLIAGKIDAAIFPEENRALLDAPRLGLGAKPTAIVYNGCSSPVQPIAPSLRNRRFFYGGLLHPELTYGDYFFDGALDRFPIDLFGLVDGYRDPEAKIDALAARHSAVSYNGYVPSGTDFLNVLRQYEYSIVIWAPVTEATRFAAPNKFFDAIHAGVPPLSAPHPLCARLIERYGCGVLMGGWSARDLKRGLVRAARLKQTGAYARMVEEKIPIARADLCWDAQFRKVAALLEGI